MTSGEKTEQETPAGPAKPGKRRIQLLQILLVVNTVLVIVVIGVVLGIIPKPSLRTAVAPLAESFSPRQASAYQTLQDNTNSQAEDLAKQLSGEKPDLLSSTGPAESKNVQLPMPARPKMVSWPEAEKLLRNKDFGKAMELFQQLVINSRPNTADELVCDYFSFRIAECLIGQANDGQARALLGNLSESASPVIRAVAEFKTAELDLAEGKFLNARSHAYRSIASLGAMERPMQLEGDCNFLIARSLTSKVRSFKTVEKFIRWPGCLSQDPFHGLDKNRLRAMLAEGKGLVTPRAFGPELKISQDPKTPGRWEITCSNVTAQELLNQFCDKAKLEISWLNTRDNVIRRPVSMHFRAISAQKLNEVTAGMVGLISRFTLEKAFIQDPMRATTAAKQREMISNEAISAWRLFFLRFPRDPRLPEAHFALAAIREWNGENVEAQREYQLMAKRFERSKIAPYALLRSAKIKMAMMDYTGARTDLMDLLDMYPDHPGVADVYMMLGEAMEEAGDWAKAARNYENLSHRNLSASSRTAACLGTGRSHFKNNDYDKATKWLARYVAMLEEPNPKEYVDAYFMLGKSEAKRGNLNVAVQAYHRGFLGHPAAKVRIPAINELAGLYIKQENYVGAIKILNMLGRERLTTEQACTKALLEAQVFRSIGLVDKARSILRMELSRVNDPDIRSQIGMGLAGCHIASSDYVSARNILMEILPSLSPGENLWQASMELADICIKLNSPDQAIKVIEPVLASNCPDPIRRKAASTLGEAYLLKKEYDKAAFAFSGLKNYTDPLKDQGLTAKTSGETK